MGDIADWLIDSDPWINGLDLEEYKQGIYNPIYSRLPTCAYCKKRCSWRKDQGLWRLYYQGAPHICQQYLNAHRS